ncbi:MAG: hypothetical protein GOU99_01230, partial [Candidatus Altiarchaeota archaeon]|nr:hypothetical protein [Candidatus Altiarchaeota archaeon]
SYALNGVCPSSNCISSDPDCCSDDADCSTLPGGTYFCSSSISTCQTCAEYLDYYCPSNTCDGIDPDCCNIDADCPEGMTCYNSSGRLTCIGNLGQSCSSDSDCTGGLVCRDNLCTIDSFLIVQPQEVTVKLGQSGKTSITIIDPQLKTDSYAVEVTNPLASFAHGKRSEFTLRPGEIHSEELLLMGGYITTESIEVRTFSLTNAEVQASRTITLIVESTISSPLVAAAPGISFSGILATLILGGAFAWMVRYL